MGQDWKDVPCKEWQGKRHRSGYGLVREKSAPSGAWHGAHRVAWEEVNGPIPKGMHVLHKCDNPPCTEVAHLFLGTQASNMEDMRAKGRGAVGSMLPQTVFTDEVAADIRVRYVAGESQGKLGKEFGVTHGAIGRIVRGESHKSAGGPVSVCDRPGWRRLQQSAK